MAQPENRRRGARFSLQSLRVLKEAVKDDGLAYFRRSIDLPMVLAFLEAFDHLGWFPPIDEEKRRTLAAHDVIMHQAGNEACYYEFVSKGARGEREPWLSIFFHADGRSQIRICSVERTLRVSRRRDFYQTRVSLRVQRLERWLKRRKEN
jgi:hypothetical protein